MGNTTATATTTNNTHSEHMQVKRKQSTLEKLANDNASTTSIPSTVAKRPRSDSIESKTSSWFQRLYASTSMHSLPDTKKEKEDKEHGGKPDNIHQQQQGDNNHEESTVAVAAQPPAADSDSTPRGGDGNGGDGNDDNTTGNDNGKSSSKNDNYLPQTGLWSWLIDSGAMKQQQEQQQSKEVSKIKAVEKSSDNRTSTPVPSESSLATTKDELNNSNGNREPRTSTSSPWRSFFWSSSDQRDSVIIEKTNDPQQQQQQQQQRASTPSLSTPSPSSSITKKNMVLPPIHGDLPAPSHPSDQDLNPNLLTKALRAINTMFSPPPPTSRVNRRFTKFVQAMKTHPEDVACKKFVIIGVHGWFPMKLVRSVIGEPTGTSLKFCEQMVQGLKTYFKETHDLAIPHHAITTIPLEGEGKVGERVDMLYRNLVANPAWVSALASADVVFWATHSQGTPVSAILLSRLIEEKLVRVPEQPVCFLAMAGISHGPFPSLKGNLLVKYFEADAARELFEFMDSSSDIAQRYRQSIAYLLCNDIKTVLIGSMQDQVVPLYSAIMAGASHPNILRAIYIDGHVYSDDDFLINLIIFALKLRNKGLSDHGLLTHLSEVLAGDLYSWEGGHSTVYEEVGVFTLAVQHLFESGDSRTAVRNSPDAVLLDPFEAKMRVNPFYLPWAMRGICDDTLVLGDQVFSHELEKLHELFERWKPASAKLREIKFRLEPFKARL